MERFEGRVRLGGRIRSRREEMGLKQRELATAIQKDTTYISYVEKSKMLPSEEAARDIARELKENPDEYAKVLQKERILAKAEEKNETIESIELSTLVAFLHEAERSYRYRGFTAANFILKTQRQIVEAVNRGISVNVILAEPTIENLFHRVQEEEKTIEKLNSEYLAFRLQQQQLKFWTAIYFFRGVYLNQVDKIAEYFKLRLDPIYTSDRALIIDDRICFRRPDRGSGGWILETWWSNALIITPDDGVLFEEIQGGFLEAWQRSQPVDWKDKRYFGEKKQLITKSDVEKHRESLKQRSEAAG